MQVPPATPRYGAKEDHVRPKSKLDTSDLTSKESCNPTRTATADKKQASPNCAHEKKLRQESAAWNSLPPNIAKLGKVSFECNTYIGNSVLCSNSIFLSYRSNYRRW